MRLLGVEESLAVELEQADLRVQVALEVVRDEAHLLSRPDVAVLLVALGELDRQRGGRLGVTSAISHPGVAPTSPLAARPEMGRTTDTFSVRVIRRMSAMGVLVGTPESAGLPALRAATAPDPSSAFYGPQSFGGTGGRPGPPSLWPSLRSKDDARRLWDPPQELTGVEVDVAVPRD